MATGTILDVLVAKSIITLDDATSIRNDTRRTGKSIVETLVARGVDQRAILQAKSEVLAVPIWEGGSDTISFDVLQKIPIDSARTYKIVALEEEDGMLKVGMTDPENLEAREALQFISSGLASPVKIFLISESDFEKMIKGYKGISSEVHDALGAYKIEQTDRTQQKIGNIENESFEVSGDIESEAPVTKMVSVTLQHAIEGRASDVHIEPGDKKVRVRFRVDGELHTSILLPRDVHEAIVSRIKIMANLKIDEKRIPQDGRFKMEIAKRQVDFRVSTFPTYFGEKVVIRILDQEHGVSKLAELGFGGRNLSLIEEVLKKPFGLVLVTGPTGSGKSTTLYAMMQHLNNEKRNVISLEDPIEYYINGINQSQMRPEIGYTFSSGLRSVLRQDPDVIMVGEIRDQETAKLAIHAALTGHLVLSTLHTNNAVGVIPRLIDMGVDPFLLPATLNLAIAQRLARTLCADSRKEIKLEGKIKQKIEKETAGFPENEVIEMPKVIYEALPSVTCPKGTKGRMAVNEVLTMTDELEEIILKKGASQLAIEKEALRQGMVTMRQDGIKKVLMGKLGLEGLSEVAV